MEVSVIIPVYNAAPFVRMAVETALMQPEVIEVLVIEDGSEDNSLQICKDLALQYQQVKLLTHAHGRNRGAGASRNLGICAAKGDFIAFLDADDYYVPNRFYHAKKIFSLNKDAEGVYERLGLRYDLDCTDQYGFAYSSHLKTSILYADTILPDKLFNTLMTREGFTINLNCLTIKVVEKIKNLMFDESLLMTQDTDYILQLSRVARLYQGNMCYAVSVRRIHSNNRINQVEVLNYYKLKFIQKWFELARENTFSRDVVFYLVKRHAFLLASSFGGGCLSSKICVRIYFIKLILSNTWIVRKFF